MVAEQRNESVFGDAKWIWCGEQSVHDYNLVAQFKREFSLESVENGSLKITADSWYRV